jgi:hypothetical protein
MPSNWPADLPQNLLVDGYAQAIGDGRLSTKPDAGPPMTRLRTNAVAEPLSGNFPPMTGEQLVTMRAFVKTDLAGGSLPFMLPDPLGGDPLLVKFTDDGLPSWNARRRNRYSVSVKLWILP